MRTAFFFLRAGCWDIVSRMSVNAPPRAVEDLSARLLGLARQVSEELHPGRQLRRPVR
ncbi:MAG: hypothetical protein ACE5EG_10965 [Thermoanaerobaculia bacterium]